MVNYYAPLSEKKNIPCGNPNLIQKLKTKYNVDNWNITHLYPATKILFQ